MKRGIDTYYPRPDREEMLRRINMVKPPSDIGRLMSAILVLVLAFGVLGTLMFSAFHQTVWAGVDQTEKEIIDACNDTGKYDFKTTKYVSIKCEITSKTK